MQRFQYGGNCGKRGARGEVRGMKGWKGKTEEEEEGDHDGGLGKEIEERNEAVRRRKRMERGARMEIIPML